MEQEGESWLAWRRQGISASDSPIILGESPWGTYYGLWMIKTKRSEEQFSSFAMERGKRLEGKVRDRFILSTGIDLEAATGEWKENPLFRASFDGVNFEQRIGLEVKCPGRPNFDKIKTTREIPSYYKIQCEQQLMVGDLDLIHFVAYWEDENGQNEEEVHIEYRSDPVRRERIVKEGLEFWEFVKRDIAPPLSDLDVLTLEPDQMFNDLVSLYREYKLSKEAFETLKDEIASRLTHTKVRCGDVLYTKTKNGNYKCTIKGETE